MTARTEAGPIRVLVVDDQQLMREGLVTLLGLLDDVEVVGDAGDGHRALELVAETAPDLVLMDLRMPVMDGVEATRQIAASHPDVGVLVLTTYDDDESIAGALRAGARGYVTKDAGRSEIATALRSVATGHATFDPAVSRRLIAGLGTGTDTGTGAGAGTGAGELTGRAGRRPDGLTAREAEVLGLIARGLTNSEIAGSLVIGEATVKTHINNAFAKIGSRTRADAVRYAYENGLTNPDTI